MLFWMILALSSAFSRLLKPHLFSATIRLPHGFDKIREMLHDAEKSR